MDSLNKFPHALETHSITLSIDHTTNARQEIEIVKERALDVLKGYPRE